MLHSKFFKIRHIISLFIFICAAFNQISCTQASNPNSTPKVSLGIDRVFDAPFSQLLKGKKIGLITNQTGVNNQLISSIELFKQHQSDIGYSLKALYAPEHGLYGEIYAAKDVPSGKTKDDIIIHSLHGNTRRPTKEMLEGIDLLVFDIQDIGSRSYTFISTLFYVMEEAARYQIPVLILDRPNPINGLMIDGPLLEDRFRSFIGYINVPYCHGMTVAELASYFNSEYAIDCKLSIVPMKGWKRSMTFADTQLAWIPTSPNIPEATTVWYYPTTGLIGELSLANIGIGYTLPFRLIGAPWINGQQLAEKLNRQRCPGVRFVPFYFRPFYGKFAQKSCEGVLIIITDFKSFKPVSTQLVMLSILKTLYPKEVISALDASSKEARLFNQACGTSAIFDILRNKTYTLWELKALHEKERTQFAQRRKKYLIKDYESRTAPPLAMTP